MQLFNFIIYIFAHILKNVHYGTNITRVVVAFENPKGGVGSLR